jgi:hypothetical protein
MKAAGLTHAAFYAYFKSRKRWPARAPRALCPLRVVCHEHRRSTRRCVNVPEMKEGPSGSAVRSLIPSHRELLRSKAVVVSVAETPGQ